MNLGRFIFEQEKVHRKYKESLIDSSVPILRLNNPSSAVAKISARLQRGDIKSPRWTHGQVAVPKDDLGDLSALGFKKMRLAVPLPGERILTATYVRENLHAHQQGPFYLFHWDETPAETFLRSLKRPKETLKHIAKESLSAWKLRYSKIGRGHSFVLPGNKGVKNG